MKLQSLLIAGVIFVEILSIKLWIVCKNLSDNFYFSSFDVKLKVDDEIHNDVGYGVEVVRVFHNKIGVSFEEILSRYFSFWDINFLASVFSLVGVFGIICGFWYLFTSKKKTLYAWFIAALLLLLPFIEVFKGPLPFELRIGIWWLAYTVLSLYGIWQFLKHHKKGWLVISILIVLSLWYILIIQSDIFANFCYNK